MSKITSKQRKFLRAKAHNLKPVVVIGAAGLTDNIHTEIDIALEHHELIKVRINSANKESRQKLINVICSKSNGIAVQTIGHILVLYKKVKDAKILLPKD
ncbi:RNA-binding protein YhbY [hydrothermal vent metagenome]|uniref:RNA-binding protein YhbY n=1 Tax=hydrothermal vent metagenome TaxID=652676 RepID=A0A3B1AL20_9ZZZZ